MHVSNTDYNDGIEVSPEVIDGILSELYRVFGGYSVDGGVTKRCLPDEGWNNSYRCFTEDMDSAR